MPHGSTGSGVGKMKLEKWITCLQAAVLAFFISYGGCACLVSGFSLQADMGTLALWCGCLGAVTAVCFRLRLAAVPLGLLALLCGYLWHSGSLSLSTEALLYWLSYNYNAAYGIGILRWSDLPLQEADVTAALCAVASVNVLLTVRTVCRCRRAILPAVFGLLPLCACLVVTDTVPAAKHLILLFFGLTVLMLSQTTRRADRVQGNRLAALVAAPAALAVALLFWLNPQQTYSRQQQADELLQFAQDALTQQLSQAGTAVTKRENLASMGALSNPHLAVMDVTASQSGTLYLREQVFDTYDGRQWTFSDRYSALPEHTLEGLRLAGNVKITTRYTLSNLYIPYYTADSLPGSNGYTENPENLKTYSYKVLSLRNPDAYSAFSQLYPAALPADTQAWAQSVLAPVVQGLHSNASYPRAIADYVRQSASYSKQTPRMPSDKTDFVRWFLEESETGYCAHFASATAVLLQAAGIPARYVTGYTVSVDSGTSTTVYMDEAHAWVEFYDPAVGWRVLESTPGDGLPTDTEQPTEPQEATASPATGPSVQDSTVPEVTYSQQTDPADIPTSPRPQTELRWLEPVLTVLACALGGVLLILGQWQLRRRLILRRLTQGEANRRAVAHWRQTVLLSRLLRQRPDPELFSLAQKAKFSQHTLTEEELTVLETGLRNAQQRLKAKPLPYRIFCRLIFAVY